MAKEEVVDGYVEFAWESKFGSTLKIKFGSAGRGVVIGDVVVNGVGYRAHLDFVTESKSPYRTGPDFAPGAFGYQLTRENWEKVNEMHGTRAANKAFTEAAFAEIESILKDGGVVARLKLADAKRAFAAASKSVRDAEAALKEAESQRYKAYEALCYAENAVADAAA
jgi:hypothetical protein